MRTSVTKARADKRHRVALLANVGGRPNVEFLRHLLALGFDVALVVSSSRNFLSGKRPPRKIYLVLRHITVQELLLNLIVRVVNRRPLRRIAAVGRFLERNSLEYAAGQLNVDFLRCASVNDRSTIESIKSVSADLIFLHNCSEIVSQELIDITGIYNFHAGDLKTNRGANALGWSILNGEDHITMTCHEVDAGIDTGAVVLTHEESLSGVRSYRDVIDRSILASKRCLEGFCRKLATPDLRGTKAVKGKYRRRLTAMQKYKVRRLAKRVYR